MSNSQYYTDSMGEQLLRLVALGYILGRKTQAFLTLLLPRLCRVPRVFILVLSVAFCIS